MAPRNTEGGFAPPGNNAQLIAALSNLSIQYNFGVITIALARCCAQEWDLNGTRAYARAHPHLSSVHTLRCSTL